MQKIKKNDRVIVIAGSDKGKTGEVSAVKGDKVTISGVNLKTIHKKPTSDSPGKIVKEERPVHISNVSHVDENGKAVKVKFEIQSGEGKNFTRKNRVSKKTNKKI